MLNKKTYTWKEFEAGLQRLPAELNFEMAGYLREQMQRLAKPLQQAAKARAYMYLPGTKPTLHNSRSRNRTYGLRLHQTIRTFKNEKNKYKAYAVVGNLTRMRGGAFYAHMQMSGYRPGRHKKASIAEAKSTFGQTRRGNVNTTGRYWLTAKHRQIEGKNFYLYADLLMGPMVQQQALNYSLKMLERVLARL